MSSNRGNKAQWGKSKALSVCIIFSLGCGERAEIVAHQHASSVGGGTGMGGQASGGAGAMKDPDAPHFAAPVSVAELNDPEAKEQDPTLTSDHLEIFFFSDREGNADIWASTRADEDAQWKPP